MKLKILNPMTLEVCVALDKYEEPIFENETFDADEIIELDVVGDFDPNEITELQFWNGNVVHVNSDFWTAVEILDKTP